MSKEQNGGPAFPVQHYVNSDGETFTSEPTGMLLRDWFAGMVLNGLIEQGDLVKYPAKVLASDAYEMADAMLREREK